METQELTDLLGKYTRRLRQLDGRKQEEKAEELLLSPSQMSKIENGKQINSIGTVEILAKSYGISASEFIANADVICGRRYGEKLLEIRELPYNLNSFTIEGELVHVLFEPSLVGIKESNCPNEIQFLLREINECKIRECFLVLVTLLKLLRARRKTSKRDKVSIEEIDKYLLIQGELEKKKPNERYRLIIASLLSLLNTKVSVKHVGIDEECLLKGYCYIKKDIKDTIYEYRGIAFRLLDEWELYLLSRISRKDTRPREVYHSHWSGLVEQWKEVVDRQLIATIEVGAPYRLYSADGEESIRTIYKLNGWDADAYAMFVEAHSDDEMRLCTGEPSLICKLSLKELRSYLDPRRKEAKDETMFQQILQDYIRLKYQDLYRGIIQMKDTNGEEYNLVVISSPFD